MEAHAKYLEAATRLLAAHLEEMGRKRYFGRTVLTFFMEDGKLSSKVRIEFVETRDLPE